MCKIKNKRPVKACDCHSNGKVCLLESYQHMEDTIMEGLHHSPLNIQCEKERYAAKEGRQPSRTAEM